MKEIRSCLYQHLLHPVPRALPNDWRHGLCHSESQEQSHTRRPRKLQQDIPAKRVTTEYLMEGIRKWIDEKRGVSLIPNKRKHLSNTFGITCAKAARCSRRHRRRKTSAGVGQSQRTIGCTLRRVPDESKTDEELVTMFRKLNVWPSVVSNSDALLQKSAMKRKSVLFTRNFAVIARRTTVGKLSMKKGRSVTFATCPPNFL